MQDVVKLLNEIPSDEGELVAFQELLVGMLEDVEKPKTLFPALFRFFEQVPEADLGMPGPLVHWFESNYPDYVDDLGRSLKRLPTYHVVWMANRILNANTPGEEREKLLGWLGEVEAHPEADDLCKETARQFLGIHLGE